MCIYERIGLIIFIAVLAVVYTPSLAILARHFFGRLRNGVAPKFAAWEKAVLAIGAVGLVLMAYGYFVEPYWIEVTHYTINSPKLANYQRPIRVVQISDLHCDTRDRVEQNLPVLIAAQKPDVIVFTGDSINSKQAVGVFRRCMGALSHIAPTYAVLGNHDSRCWSDLNLFKNTGVTALNGTAQKLHIAGQDVYVSGVAFDCETLAAQALAAVPSNAFSLFLYHSPDLVMDLAKRQVDLICAGHTHGGQVCLPWYGAIITQSKFGKQFESGLHRVDKTWLYVNRGIGMEGGIDPRVRFLARPEITVIDLKPESRISLRSGTH